MEFCHVGTKKFNFTCESHKEEKKLFLLFFYVDQMLISDMESDGWSMERMNEISNFKNNLDK